MVCINDLFISYEYQIIANHLKDINTKNELVKINLTNPFFEKSNSLCTFVETV